MLLQSQPSNIIMELSKVYSNLITLVLFYSHLKCWHFIEKGFKLLLRAAVCLFCCVAVARTKGNGGRLLSAKLDHGTRVHERGLFWPLV